MLHLPQTSNRGTIKYILLFISVTVIWGSSFLFVNNLVRGDIPVLLLTFLRFSIGSIFLLLFRCFSSQKLEFQRLEWKRGSELGIVIFAAFAFQTYGAAFTTPSKNGMLTGLYVIIVPLILAFITRNLRFKPFMDAIICLIGVGILFNIYCSELSINIGDFFTILCAITFSIQFVILEKHSPGFDSLNYTITQLLTVAAISLIGSLIFEARQYASLKFDVTIIAQIVFLGTLSTGYAYIIQTMVQARLPSTTVSLLSCLESVFAVAFSLTFKYEIFSINLLVGAVIMILAMMSSILLPMKKEKAGNR